jgi:hypothetical protein
MYGVKFLKVIHAKEYGKDLSYFFFKNRCRRFKEINAWFFIKFIKWFNNKINIEKVVCNNPIINFVINVFYYIIINGGMFNRNRNWEYF